MNTKHFTEAELQAHLEDVQRALEEGGQDDDKLRAEAAETRKRLARVRDDKERLLALDDPQYADTGMGPDPGRSAEDDERRTLAARTGQSHALRAIERNADLLSPEAADRLDDFVRHDRRGVDSRYLSAIADPAYERAWFKVLASPRDAHLRMSAEENRALMRANAALGELRALSLTGADGGYAVPFLLDPTVMATSDGVLNPIRGLASVKRITTDAWHGVSSAGLSAAYVAEGTAVTDGAPSDFAQPVVYAEKAHAFVGMSIEIDSDWGSLRQEVGKMFADGRDALESSKFLDGAGHGSHEPAGILTGASNTLDTAASSTYAIDDCYSLVEAIPPRFAPRASVLGNPATFDATYRFVGGASAEPPVLPTREGPFLGRRKAEWSDMEDDLTTGGGSILIAGDIAAGFVIVDRIGMQVELVPHLFDATTALPTGERGLYAWWRSGSAVVNSAALRVLQIKS